MTDRELIYNTVLSGIPYGIMGSAACHDEETNMPVEVDGQIRGLRNKGYVEFYYPDGSFSLFDINCVKPYLRPLQSMTEDEKEELKNVTNNKFSVRYYGKYVCNRPKRKIPNGLYMSSLASYVNNFDISKLVNLLNKHHFDYTGMIDKGLALPAKDGMYLTCDDACL